MARKNRHPGTRRWIAKATIRGTTTRIGTESAKIALFRRAVRKIGSLQMTWKLWNPTHSDGLIPSQRVKAW